MSRLALAALMVAVCHIAQAQSFPSKPVRFVVANPPGGTTDLIARLLAKHFGDKWGQSVIVDNRAGGGGTIGTDLVAKASPDGYTVLISAPAPITTNVTLFEKLPYDPVRDFAPVTLIAVTPSLLMVGPTVPSRSVAELIALAKARPGKLTYASAGLGNPSHLQGAMLANVAGIDVVHVPYKGGGPALTDLLGGHVDILFNAIPAMLPLVKSGRLRALAVTSRQRFAGLPDVPTMIEAGFPQIGSTAWYGVLAPAKTPNAMIRHLHAEFVGALAAPDVKSVLVSGGAEIVGSSPQQFAEFMRRETEDARKLIKLSGAKRE